MESHDRSKKSFERKDHLPSAGKSKVRDTSKSDDESGDWSHDHDPEIHGSEQPTGQPSDHKQPEDNSSDSDDSKA